MSSAKIDAGTKASVRRSIAQQISTIGEAVDDREVEEVIRDQVSAMGPSLGLDEAGAEAFSAELADDFLRLGPLEPLMSDEAISEIMVNGGGIDPGTGAKLPPVVWVEIAGTIRPCPDCLFDDDEHLMRVINRIGAQVGRECSEASPLMDARLADGSRVNAVYPSTAIDGPSLNIRRFRESVMTASALVDGGSCSSAMMEFLKSCVEARLNVIVSGGTGSGKTTLLNVLSGFIPRNERVVTIEDSAELKIAHPNRVRLEARPANSEGRGRVTIHDLVVNSLRMRPDRIIVGECRSDETIEMLQAMQTGHDGSLTTVHANNPVSVFSRLVTMCVSAQPALGPSVIERQIGEAVDLVVHTDRAADGQRRISSITSVEGYSDGVIVHNELFRSVAGRAGGPRFEACGFRPRSIEERIVHAGSRFDPAWFFDE